MEGVAGEEWCTLNYVENCGQDTTAATQDPAHFDGMKALSTWCTFSVGARGTTRAYAWMNIFSQRTYIFTRTHVHTI